MKMLKFREARKELIYVQCDSLIKDEKLFSSKRSWHLQKPNVSTGYILSSRTASDDDVISKFRFQKRDVYRSENVLGFPEKITCHFCDGLREGSTEGLCILLNIFRPMLHLRINQVVGFTSKMLEKHL